jgi:uncharacterized repeat protein (TIGR03803 family)
MLFYSWSLPSDARLASIALVASVAVSVAVTAVAPAQAGETVLYSFQSGSDGTFPLAGLVADQQGALYGTTDDGGSPNAGTIFKLTPPSSGTGIAGQWSETVLYSFCSQSNCIDGANPQNGLIFDRQGALYGTTGAGGSSGDGTVFKLTPPAAGQTQWTETVLYSFQDTPDGANPSSVIFDQGGALYGTAVAGGSSNCAGGCGTVFKLTPPAAGQTQWTESVLYSFQGGTDGVYPSAGVIFDRQGALYGTTLEGGSPNCNGGCGTVFKLAPPAAGEQQWTESVLYSFQGGSDGIGPYAGLIFDREGALYGTTSEGGGPGFGYGTVFKLAPPAAGQAQWTETVLYSFPGGTDGATPYAGLIFDQQDALYGTTLGGGSSTCEGGCGTIFKLARRAAGQTQWTETLLHTFCPQSNCTDGAYPWPALIVGAQGALYATTAGGGSLNYGTVFRQCSVEGGEVFGGKANVDCLHW